MTEWASEKELDHARNIAERGLEQLVLVSKIANDRRLIESPKDPLAAEHQILYAKDLLDEIEHRIRDLAEYGTGFYVPDKTLIKEIKTIECAWQGGPIGPFSHVENNGNYLYPTAHQAVVDWSQSFIRFINIRQIGYCQVAPAKDLPRLLLEVCDSCKLRCGVHHKLKIRIVDEWRSAREWVGNRQNTIRDIDTTNISLKLNDTEKEIIQALSELSGRGETPATNEAIAKRVGGEIKVQKVKEYTGALWRHGLLAKGENGIGYSLNEVATRALPG